MGSNPPLENAPDIDGSDQFRLPRESSTSFPCGGFARPTSDDLTPPS
jgi:hypothetical protein